MDDPHWQRLLQVAGIAPGEITLRPYRFLRTRGALLRFGQQETYLLYDDRLPRATLYRVLAHELAHYRLHGRTVYFDQKQRQAEEQEADRLAAQWLAQIGKEAGAG
jgi:hypothetical protein